jgi:hypothetical protein
VGLFIGLAPAFDYERPKSDEFGAQTLIRFEVEDRQSRQFL